MEIKDIVPGMVYTIKGESRYFETKYGTPNPQIVIECPLDFHKHFTPPVFLFHGRALSEGIPVDSNILHGRIQGLSEFVHVSELETWNRIKPGG